jgi:predicted CXXCH cytochrome family protein
VSIAACTARAFAQQPAPPVPEAVTYCLACHETKDMSITLKDGSPMSLFVDVNDLQHSVHGSHLICTDCHSKYDQDHPSGKTFDSRRAYTIGAYEICKKCHFDTYTRTLESVHYDLLKAGVKTAPICTDCHGSHNIQNPHAKRAMMSRSCATCHVSVYQTYAKSVHGRALVEDNNQDVPACADCHTHHQIQQPGTTKFRLSSPGICIRCHGDERLMAKYGISTTVAQTYLADFHGVTASLTKNASADKQQVVVTCVDCHGMHDIASPKLKGQEAMKATVSAACAKCHQGTAPGFPAAWLSHYPPSPRHAPLVWAVQIFYTIFIPFIVIGLILHLLLHVYRMSAGR